MALAYTIVDSFSIIFLLILFISTREKSSLLTENLYFRTIVLMTAVALVGDMLAWQLDGIAGIFPRYMLWIANVLCYILSGAMTFTWLYYSALKMNYISRISKARWFVYSIPFIFLTAVSLSTPWTHWLFNINTSNEYERGPLFFIQIVIPFGYILAAAIWALHKAGSERLRQQRAEYLSLASFIIFPIIGGVLQFAVYGISLAWPCAALSLMLVYVSMQNQKISLDALTGLNNRGQFDKYIFSCVEHSDNDTKFALFMLDIDNFKKINDEYGHIVGDAALIDASAVLKKSLSATNSFLARYGGDEFAIVLRYQDEEQVDSLVVRINEESENQNSISAAPYKLVFSIGYVCYNRHRYTNYQDMIIAADAQMYIQKRQHKAERH